MSYEELRKAVMDFFGDTSRSAGATRADLIAIKDEIDVLIETIDPNAPADDEDGDG